MATATMQHSPTEKFGTAISPRAEAALPPLLVATDATSGSDAALRAARAIAARTRQPVKLLAVFAPAPVTGPEVQVAVASQSEWDQRVALRMALSEQAERITIPESWPVEIEMGDPASTIARAAASLGAEMVIMGLGGHELVDRVFGDEMVLRVLRLGTTPILAVADSFHALPCHALAAVDFSASCGRALKLGGKLLASPGRISLVHVAQPDKDPASWNARDAAYVGTVGRALDRLIAETDVAPGVRFERKVLSGDPAQLLLSYTQANSPDLIIAGSHGHNFLTRLMIGSVSTRLLRDSRRSMLIVPPVDGPGYLEEMPEERGRFAFYEWAERLEEFSRRNAGRGVILEVIDPELGAQIEEKGVPFVGASFDPRDGRVHIMCGAHVGDGHLTHSISGVTAVQLLKDVTGKDAFLRVAHGRGQTLLTLER
jgi:nucleotide-binding universal stress UspA family protein